jgi:hypothetical protein
MLDEETAREGAAVMSSLIAEIVEDAHELAVFNRDDLTDMAARADRLKAIAGDLVWLTGALGIVVRRGQPQAAGF